MYTFKFVYKIPDKVMPSSVHMNKTVGKGRIKCRNRYHLKAILTQPLKAPLAKYKHRFFLAHRTGNPLQNITFSNTNNVTVCCSQKGTNQLHDILERNYFQTTDIIKYKYRVDNTGCPKAIQSVAGRLYRVINMVGKEGSRQIIEDVAEVKGAPVPAHGNSGDYQEMVLYISDL